MNTRFIIFVMLILTIDITQAEPSPRLGILNIRTYTYAFVVQVDQQVNSNCQFPDHLLLYKSNPNYKASVSLFLSAWLNKSKISVYYDGCGENSTESGNGVHVNGWLVEP